MYQASGFSLTYQLPKPREKLLDNKCRGKQTAPRVRLQYVHDILHVCFLDEEPGQHRTCPSSATGRPLLYVLDTVLPSNYNFNEAYTSRNRNNTDAGTESIDRIDKIPSGFGDTTTKGRIMFL